MVENYQNREELARDMANEALNDRKEVVWVQDTSSIKPDDKLETSAQPVTSMATIERDIDGKVKSIHLHHQNSADWLYGKSLEDYRNNTIKIQGDMITGDKTIGPLKIVKRNVTPEQTWTAKHGTDSEYKK
jgi:hypothetical protein